MAIELTDKKLQSLMRKTVIKRTETRDTGVRGLAFVKQPGAAGSGSFVLRYRFGGVQRKLHIGPYPGLTLADARKQGERARAVLADGRDPAAEKQAAKGTLKAGRELAVARVTDRFIAEYIEVKAGPKSAYEMTRLLRHDVVPAWGSRQIASITESDIEALLDKIVARGSPMVANKVLSVLKTMFSWRPIRRLVGPSPCADIERPVAEIPRDRVLTNEELRDSYLAAADPSLGQYGRIFRLLILTGKRKSEVAGMRWSELSLKDGTWLIPAGRAKTASEDLVQLSEPAIEILRGIPQTPDVDLVFHENGKPLTSFSRAKASLDVLLPAGTAKFRIHDWRRTYATVVAGLKRAPGVNFEPHVVEALLGHRGGVIRGVARTYNRYAYAEEKKLATADFARFLLGLIKNRLRI